MIANLVQLLVLMEMEDDYHKSIIFNHGAIDYVNVRLHGNINQL